MEIKELREKTDKQLYRLLAEFREKFRDSRFKVASKQLKNVREIRKTKRIIAKILTLLKERGSITKPTVSKKQSSAGSKESSLKNNKGY